MRYVFLDVDGVLNSKHTTELIDGFIPLDPVNISAFRILMERLYDTYGKDNILLVLASSWRAGKDKYGNRREGDIFLATLKSILNENGIPLDDETPELVGGRGEEIVQYLSETSSVEGYLVLDDYHSRDFDEFFITRHWFKTLNESENGTGGFLEEHIEYALAKIQKPLMQDEIQMLRDRMK